MSMIWVEACESVSDELVTAMAALVPQLSSSSPPPGEAELREIVDSDATHLLIARDGDGPGLGGDIVGTMTLVVFRIPTGVRAWVEDVVVDGGGAGQGRRRDPEPRRRSRSPSAHGARTVDLTSRPSREAANRLYQRLGFVQRETNVYRYER